MYSLRKTYEAERMRSDWQANNDFWPS